MVAARSDANLVPTLAAAQRGSIGAVLHSGCQRRLWAGTFAGEDCPDAAAAAAVADGDSNPETGVLAVEDIPAASFVLKFVGEQGTVVPLASYCCVSFSAIFDCYYDLLYLTADSLTNPATASPRPRRLSCRLWREWTALLMILNPGWSLSILLATLCR